MKIQKLTESVFEKLKDATTVINPVTADAVKDNDMREKAVEKILKERGQGKEFTGSSEKTPEVPVFYFYFQRFCRSHNSDNYIYNFILWCFARFSHQLSKSVSITHPLTTSVFMSIVCSSLDIL